MTDFSEQIRNWYLLNFRKLPWRTTKNPYKIWVSEVILQQTRINQGLDYYYRFLEAFPDIKALARAPEEKVLKAWQGLGYYSRARNMHKAANVVVKTHNGRFPSDYTTLLSLPGIGPYTAAAVSSFAANEAQAVVDGNVLRVLSRYFEVEEPVDSTSGRKAIEVLARQVLPTRDAATHNQAIMELGALVCTPRPKCEACPVAETCAGRKSGKADRLPVKSATTSVRDRYLYYHVVTDFSHTVACKRSGRDIWQGMYDFPHVESDKPVKNPDFTSFLDSLIGKAGRKKIKVITNPPHLLSHQRLHITFIITRASPKRLKGSGTVMSWKQFEKKAHPRPIENFYRQYRNLLHNKTL